MPALAYDLHIEQGSEYHLRIPVLGEDDLPLLMAGWGVRGVIRAHPGSPYVLYDLDNALSLGQSWVDLTILGDTSALWEWRQGVYDVELIDLGGSPFRLLQGRVHVSPEVTH